MLTRSVPPLTLIDWYWLFAAFCSHNVVVISAPNLMKRLFALSVPVTTPEMIQLPFPLKLLLCVVPICSWPEIVVAP